MHHFMEIFQKVDIVVTPTTRFDSDSVDRLDGCY